MFLIGTVFDAINAAQDGAAGDEIVGIEVQADWNDRHRSSTRADAERAVGAVQVVIGDAGDQIQIKLQIVRGTVFEAGDAVEPVAIALFEHRAWKFRKQRVAVLQRGKAGILRSYEIRVDGLAGRYRTARTDIADASRN